VCFDFTYKLAWNISLSKKSWARRNYISTMIFTWSTHYGYQVETKLSIISTDFRKIGYSSILKENHSLLAELFLADGWTDGGHKGVQTWQIPVSGSWSPATWQSSLLDCDIATLREYSTTHLRKFGVLSISVKHYQSLASSLKCR